MAFLLAHDLPSNLESVEQSLQYDCHAIKAANILSFLKSLVDFCYKHPEKQANLVHCLSKLIVLNPHIWIAAEWDALGAICRSVDVIELHVNGGRGMEDMSAETRLKLRSSILIVLSVATNIRHLQISAALFLALDKEDIASLPGQVAKLRIADCDSLVASEACRQWLMDVKNRHSGVKVLDFGAGNVPGAVIPGLKVSDGSVWSSRALFLLAHVPWRQDVLGCSSRRYRGKRHVEKEESALVVDDELALELEMVARSTFRSNGVEVGGNEVDLRSGKTRFLCSVESFRWDLLDSVHQLWNLLSSGEGRPEVRYLDRGSEGVCLFKKGEFVHRVGSWGLVHVRGECGYEIVHVCDLIPSVFSLCAIMKEFEILCLSEFLIGECVLVDLLSGMRVGVVCASQSEGVDVCVDQDIVWRVRPSRLERLVCVAEGANGLCVLGCCTNLTIKDVPNLINHPQEKPFNTHHQPPLLNQILLTSTRMDGKLQPPGKGLLAVGHYVEELKKSQFAFPMSRHPSQIRRPGASKSQLTTKTILHSALSFLAAIGLDVVGHTASGTFYNILDTHTRPSNYRHVSVPYKHAPIRVQKSSSTNTYHHFYTSLNARYPLQSHLMPPSQIKTVKTRRQLKETNKLDNKAPQPTLSSLNAFLREESDKENLALQEVSSSASPNQLLLAGQTMNAILTRHCKLPQTSSIGSPPQPLPWSAGGASSNCASSTFQQQVSHLTQLIQSQEARRETLIEDGEEEEEDGDGMSEDEQDSHSDYVLLSAVPAGVCQVSQVKARPSSTPAVRFTSGHHPVEESQGCVVVENASKLHSNSSTCAESTVGVSGMEDIPSSSSLKSSNQSRSPTPFMYGRRLPNGVAFLPPSFLHPPTSAPPAASSYVTTSSVSRRASPRHCRIRSTSPPSLRTGGSESLSCSEVVELQNRLKMVLEKMGPLAARCALVAQQLAPLVLSRTIDISEYLTMVCKPPTYATELVALLTKPQVPPTVKSQLIQALKSARPLPPIRTKNKPF